MFLIFLFFHNFFVFCFSKVFVIPGKLLFLFFLSPVESSKKDGWVNSIGVRGELEVGYL